MSLRHEHKHIISYSDRCILRQRLSAVMKPDKNGLDGKYKIRSLYFDNLRDTALLEKIDGVNVREKFRLRYYNGKLSYIVLEKKSKINGLCRKESIPLTVNEVEKILNGDTAWMAESKIELLNELYSKMNSKGLKPKTIVDYTREAYTFPAGNVRVTLDYDIRTGIRSTDFLNPLSVTVPVRNNAIVLEVKWDEFLPDTVRYAVNLNTCRRQAYSKYAACRIYG